MSSEVSENNKRIAKNTMLMYFRTLVVMILNLYTSRLALRTLGFQDFGIYNVVAGCVSMFTLASSWFVLAISRFITIEVGRGDLEQLQKVYSTSMLSQIVISLSLFAVCEFLGVYFIYDGLNIPAERQDVALYVFHFSTVLLLVSLLSAPQIALLTAYESFNVLAIVAIIEAVFKFLSILIVLNIDADKLFLYSLFLLVVQVLIRVIYWGCCSVKFRNVKVKWCFDRSVFVEMTRFSVWNLFGNVSYMAGSQGINVLVNLLFGVIYNASRGIAAQVEGSVNVFVANFQSAAAPQIIKYYAAGDYDNFHSLINRSIKFTNYIFLFVMVPVIVEADTLLYYWLEDVPVYTVDFVRLTMFSTYAMYFSGPMSHAIVATGNLKKYQLIVFPVALLVLPLSYIFILLLRPVAGDSISGIVYIINGIVYFMITLVRVKMLEQLSGYKPYTFWVDVLVPVLKCLPVVFVLPFVVHCCLGLSFVRLFVVCVISVVVNALVIYYCGLTVSEKGIVVAKVVSVKKFFIR